MKTVTPQLQNLLLTKSFVQCDLYSFTLTSGVNLRYSTADIDIGDGAGNVYSAKGPYFDKVQTHKGFHAKTGLDTDSWEVTVAPRLTDPVSGAAYPDTIGNVPWLQAAVMGVLAGATVNVHRQYFPSWPTGPWGLNNPYPPASPQLILQNLFVGRVGAMKYSRTTATITLNSWMNLLSTTNMPAAYYGGNCRFTLFDAGCGLTAATFARQGHVTQAPGYNVPQLAIAGTNLTLPAGLSFALGRVVMTSGACSGLSKRVLSWNPNSGVLGLDYSFPFAIAAGDTLTVYAGCDKSVTMCTQFGNLVNYGGTPYVPPPELAF